MILELAPGKTGQPDEENDASAARAAGRRLAQSIAETRPHGGRAAKTHKGQGERILARAFSAPEPFRAAMLDNTRLIHTAAKQAKEFATGLHRFPVAAGPFGE